MKVVTINIAGINFNWFEQRRKSLVTSLKKISPDIVFLQETTILPERDYDQSKDIGEQVGLLSMVFAPYGNSHEYLSQKLGGIAVLSRWPFLKVQNRKLPPGKLDPFGARVALMATINTPQRPITFATTHLSYRPEELDLRVEQTKEFLELLKLSKDSIIFGGDFNASFDEPAIQELSSSYQDTFLKFHSKQEGKTWCKAVNDYVSSEREDARIDYIFSSNDLKVANSEVILDYKNPVYPSDHFGVLTEFLY